MVPSIKPITILDTYSCLTLKNILEDREKPKAQCKKNLKRAEIAAPLSLRNNKDFVIKPAGKGGAIVIINKKEFMKEGLRQLENTQHYETLDEDPTKNIMRKETKSETRPIEPR